jgi:hypothetical protein
MARQQDSCWRCGTEWVPEAQPSLRLIPTDADADHRTDEREGLPTEVTLPLPAIAAIR